MTGLWEINADWKHDPGVANEVEVKFIAEGRERTRVELEHRKIERYGDKAEAMHKAFDSPDGCAGLLRAMAQAAGESLSRAKVSAACDTRR